MLLKWHYFVLFKGWVIFHCMYYNIFFFHASFDGLLGCFHVLALVNSAAMNIGVHVSFWIIGFSGYMPRSGIAVSYDSSTFCSLKISILFFIMVISIYIPTNSVEGLIFSAPAPVFIFCRYFNDGLSDQCEVIPHCNFDLH